MEKLQLVKNIYIYALSGIMLIIFLVSIINTLTEIPNYIYPDVYLPTLEEYQSQTSPQSGTLVAQPVPINEPTKPIAPPTLSQPTTTADTRTPDQIKLEWQQKNDETTHQERTRAVKRIFTGAILSIVSFAAFMFFHRERKAIDAANRKK